MSLRGSIAILILVSFCCDHAFGAFATGVVSQTCLNCICKQESGCAHQPCRMDVGSLSCGYFQLKHDYWVDCGSPGHSLEQCSNDLYCASSCVQKYMERYIGHSGCAHNCESYARIHNGGPSGCRHTSTIQYWDRMKSQQHCSTHS